MTRRPIALAALAALLCACGGDERGDAPTAEDHAASFTGAWAGDLELLVDGRRVGAGPERTDVTRQGPNRIALTGPCPDGSAVPALVVDAGSFTLLESTCPAVAASGCSAVTVRVNGGGGTLTDGVLALTVDAAMTGCGRSFALHIELTGAKPVPPGAASVVPGTGLAGDAGATLGADGTAWRIPSPP